MAEKPITLADDVLLEQFETAFDARVGSSVRTCDCGVTFYNPTGGWSWEEGELEALEKRRGAVSLQWSVGCLSFEGRDYVPDCSCWKPRASTIIRFLIGHSYGIADFLRLEKKRKQAAADSSPTVEP